MIRKFLIKCPSRETQMVRMRAQYTQTPRHLVVRFWDLSWMVVSQVFVTLLKLIH